MVYIKLRPINNLLKYFIYFYILCININNLIKTKGFNVIFFQKSVSFKLQSIYFKKIIQILSFLIQNRSNF